METLKSETFQNLPCDLWVPISRFFLAVWSVGHRLLPNDFKGLLQGMPYSKLLFKTTPFVRPTVFAICVCAISCTAEAILVFLCTYVNPT